MVARLSDSWQRRVSEYVDVLTLELAGKLSGSSRRRKRRLERWIDRRLLPVVLADALNLEARRYLSTLHPHRTGGHCGSWKCRRCNVERPS